MNPKIIQQQADAAMYVYETFATDSAEVARHLGVSKSVARTRLAALEGNGLCCADLQEAPERGGLVNRGERVGEHNVWQMASFSIDDTTGAEAAAAIFSTLGVWPTGHGPATPAADAATTEGVPVTETTNPETPATPAEDAPAAPADTPAPAGDAEAAKAPAKKAPAKKAAPKKALTAADVKAIKPAASIAEDHASRVGDAAGDAAPGYVVRWPKKGYDLLVKTAAAPADAPKWLVRCNEHGTTLPVSGGREGDQKGRLQERQVWCPGCKAAKGKAPAKPAAAKKATPAKKAPARKAAAKKGAAAKKA